MTVPLSNLHLTHRQVEYYNGLQKAVAKNVFLLLYKSFLEPSSVASLSQFYAYLTLSGHMTGIKSETRQAGWNIPEA